ncbi:NADH dehydrogenase [ubiquinone] 1 alpha subcomplex subunit 11-like [Gigantopelta aegis]|uniref:NADH dehydrogenase [ubiquinone] 1 alpha subcomplex subunit 11-like n=1 Tax=Gigantopelta aegis TaxID=1735272 RepID=UPI001B88945D|nr:NADH dehydrogenase [ubiquinone] 1 alpha subcomplex subunit 11-like [Gigantopelta aegis]
MAGLNYPRPKTKYYSIYDKPDNDDCMKKVCYGTVYGGLFGTFVSVFDTLGYSRPGTMVGAAQRCGFHTSLFALAGAAYTSVTVLSASMRKKDDTINHFFGGLAAGGVFGARANSQKVGWGLGIAFGLTGITIKLFRMSGMKFYPVENYRYERSFFDYRKSYFTDRPDPEGNPDI